MENSTKKPLITTKTVVAIGIGAALYYILSYVSIPVAPNTSLRPAVAMLTIIGAFFGPIAGFFAGFIGHALFDALSYGSVWWSWVALSAVLGLSQGLIFLNKSFSISKGQCDKKHIVLMYIYTIAGIIVAGLFAYAGDVFLYGEPADKVWLQITLSTVANFACVAVIGIPVVIALAKMNQKNVGLEN